MSRKDENIYNGKVKQNVKEQDAQKQWEDFEYEKTLEEYIHLWLIHQKTKVKASTYSTYLHILHSQILPKLGKMELHAISEEVIEEFLWSKSENGRTDGKGGLSAKTCSDIMILLYSIFEYIEKTYHYPNPMADVKRMKTRKKSPEPLSQSENQILTHFLLGNMDAANMGIALSLFMGLRLGEICALRWENIDVERQVIHIRQTIYRVLNENATKEDITQSKTVLLLSSPKTEKSIRDIPIPVFLNPYLKQLQKAEGYYLLTGTKQPMDPRTFQNYFKRVLKKCNMRSIPFHSLRHTFATNCVILGFDIKTLSEILGHANTRITLETYVHSSFYQKQMQMMKLSESVSML